MNVEKAGVTMNRKTSIKLQNFIFGKCLPILAGIIFLSAIWAICYYSYLLVNWAL